MGPVNNSGLPAGSFCRKTAANRQQQFSDSAAPTHCYTWACIEISSRRQASLNALSGSMCPLWTR